MKKLTSEEIQARIRNNARSTHLYIKRDLVPQKKSQDWKICIDNPFYNCEKVYPIQQKNVRFLIDALKKDENVNRIIIFGSSVTDRCHNGSDVDIYADLKADKRPYIPACDFVYDLWTNYTVDENLLKEILSKGVIVYG